MYNVIPANTKQWKANSVSSKASTEYTQASLLYNDGTNTVPAVATTERVSGICQTAKSSSDSSTDPVKYLTSRELDAPFEMTVGTGTISKSDEGKSFDLKSSTEVDATANSHQPVTLYKYLSSTKGLFVINYDKGIDD